MDVKDLEHKKSKQVIIDAIYFIGSALFFYLQLNTAISFAFYSSLSLKEAFYALLCFKVGEFIHEKFDGLDSSVWIMLLGVSALGIAINPNLVLLYMVFSLSMMKIRDAARVYSSKAVKVYGRALGFLLAPFKNPYIFAAFTLLLIIVAYLKRYSYYKDNKLVFHSIKSKNNRLSFTIMGTHHAHYFVYAYTIPLVFAQDSTFPVYLSGLIFYLGWAAYNAYEKLLKPRWIYFIVGHIIAALSLMGLYFIHSTMATLTFWFATGLGGGTIYMLPELITVKEPSTNRELRLSEAIGHITGISLWGILSLVYWPRLVLLAGCSLSLVTVLLATIQSNKRKTKSETIKASV